ncbi:toll-like receptor 10 isoform X2 [Leopardus geoffroyi]|uniref:toll-like receptor 10 isoform X2 n=1 Tax=Leopardus geoffroyi TaxID=46844 RepID=UPI001E25F068|nr:toll-like receptor 10 isoform X2 [Leopardus geoffroyi]
MLCMCILLPFFKKVLEDCNKFMQHVMPLACSRGQRSLSFTEKLDSSTPAASSGPANKSSTPAALLEPLQTRGCLRVWIFFHWSLIKPVIQIAVATNLKTYGTTRTGTILFISVLDLPCVWPSGYPNGMQGSVEYGLAMKFRS